MKFLRHVFLVGILAVCLLPMTVQAASEQAEDITGSVLVQTNSGFDTITYLFDGEIRKGGWAAPGAELTLRSPEGIGSIYMSLDEVGTHYTVTNAESGESVEVEPEDFYHRFTDVSALFEGAPSVITLTFPNGAGINEVYVFSEGEVPDWVQRWQRPVQDGADLVLFSTHGDDEQLFFAGILPYYAGELGYKVQVVYLTDHRTQNYGRIHEMLNGLWSVGVRNYPVYRSYPDEFNHSNLDGAYILFSNHGITKDELVSYVVENLRRFKPTVAIGHDFNGEYGHEMHMMYSDMLRQAVELSNEPTYHQDSAEIYGLWDVPKTYIHLYSENQIVMDWDIPLEHFHGMTAFEVTRDIGYPCHQSQYEYFTWYYIDADTAKHVKQYSPCEYGLYRTTVGEDVQKNDFFENVVCYTEQAKMDEIARQEEEARLKAEEEERLRQEEEARKQAEQEAAAEQERLQAMAEQQAAETESAQRRRIIGFAAAAAVVVLMIFAVILIAKKKKQKISKK